MYVPSLKCQLFSKENFIVFHLCGMTYRHGYSSLLKIKKVKILKVKKCFLKVQTLKIYDSKNHL